ncbi:MAG: hypothetical protein E5W15_06960 [Mesorhizobium sp.]|uniref:hypothetical protein n=1 Tax=unclassified Mesorhizobium TaxID=325217 RepID=UPI000FCA53D8|nr:MULTISPECIES: hypothetical protein [unclassified Mesorhizobium]RUW43003.1 hypothetical protein EOA37_02295 [Mesorhizobium sp. M2A.F.Ca.ET.015.02.1.1]RVC93050.1 hypothetical protein EN739_22885 [Mesorhizobium sp. M2A.F.Ca.ET.017.03.2.1]RVD04441.1 hypothetical protein EN753_20560 [Mesorhizobium sp. M2A.F.Ca.ET.029.05.1.1]RWB47591.1 MAG: hypothetical protein EOQ46_06045 [Mesorhizobium sp.]RWB57394.1 MAG: hypothetical protein EOQ48_26025 [Mesorhizobium sp.]
MKIEIQSQQEFTYDGRVGVFLFISGPVASGLGFAWLLIALGSSPPQLVAPMLVEAAGGFAFLIGCAKMLVGRSYRHDVNIER